MNDTPPKPPSSIEALREELAKSYWESGEITSPCSTMPDIMKAYRVGFDDALAELARMAEGEFDALAASEAWIAQFKEKQSRVDEFVVGARWQHARCFARIQQLESELDNKRGAMTLEIHRLSKENERLRSALAFSLRGLEMWRTYQSPGNIAEVEERLREALSGGGDGE